METILRRYARLILSTQLKLERGDSLSINTEGTFMEFARLLAKVACEMTLQVVNIVETNHGKVVQVLQIDPVEPEIFRPETKGFVMCHLFGLDDTPYRGEEEPSSLANNVGLLGSFGLLSEPVFLDRRIAVPWANLPLPGPEWAMQLLGSTATETEMWNLFATLFRLEDDNGPVFWDSQANVLHFRKQKLNKLGPLALTVTGSGWTITTNMARDTLWAGGMHTVSSGRKFIPALPMQQVFTSLECTKTEGTISSSRPFLLLGKTVEEAMFTIEGGKVTSYTAVKGKEALDAFFSIDEGSRQVAELSLADDDTLESRYLEKGVHVHFNKAMTSHIVFGGFNLATLTTQNSSEAIEASRLSLSLVRLEVPVGSNSLSVQARDKEGNETLLMEEGVFID
ncbi:aminopeptidase [uncultured Sphaerochaeta sp.]|uniref:aminopeptidase n=1 Tax=uncultured Sphaerochaeta sp. TaxID=886478 RepID=UPI002A0A1D5A|nr:aminopeptidase [uncultured Sphaerochaeta sp.]